MSIFPMPMQHKLHVSLVRGSAKQNVDLHVHAGMYVKAMQQPDACMALCHGMRAVHACIWDHMQYLQTTRARIALGLRLGSFGQAHHVAKPEGSCQPCGRAHAFFTRHETSGCAVATRLRQPTCQRATARGADSTAVRAPSEDRDSRGVNALKEVGTAAPSRALRITLLSSEPLSSEPLSFDFA
eukprot:358551-Chlamydomonas_euryale.AAC.2